MLNGEYAIQAESNKIVNIEISVSIGGAIREIDGSGPKELINIADKNMYLDKEDAVCLK